MLTVRGNHCIFVITVQNCKGSILQLVLLRFDLSHWYLYIFHIIYFCYVFYFTFTKYQKQTRKNYLSQYRAWLVEIRNSERYRAIVENSGTPFRKVSDIYWNYDYYGSTHLTDFIIITYYWVFHVWIYFQNKKPETRHQRYYFSYRVQAPNIRAILESSQTLRARLVFCWNFTSTQVTKLIRYSN